MPTQPEQVYTVDYRGADTPTKLNSSSTPKEYIKNAINSGSFLNSLNKIQKDMLQKVTVDYGSEYVPNFNGGYIILVELGPWISLVKSEYDWFKDYYVFLDEHFFSIFESRSPMLAYNIEPGNLTNSSDSYNMRHFELPIFSYRTKIDSISVTYLEDRSNIIQMVHDLWSKFMEYYKLGYIKTPENFYKTDTDYFYSVPYYGAIWAYAYNPFDFTPKAVMKFIGVYPDNSSYADIFGNRSATEHYMKAINYRVIDTDRAIYSPSMLDPTKGSAADHIETFASGSPLMKQFVDTYNRLINQA